MTASRIAHFTAIATFSLAAACSGDPAATSAPMDAAPEFAKPAPAPPPVPMQFLFPTSGYGVLGDGLPYVDGVCGVRATLSQTEARVVADFTNLDLSCHQNVTLTLLVQHLGYDANGNDIDETVATPLSNRITTMTFRDGGNGLTDRGLINSICFHIVGKKAVGHGLRFESFDYPGSDDLAVSIGADSVWHITSRPWPDNKAFCDTDPVTFWHVDVDVTISPK